MKRSCMYASKILCLGTLFVIVTSCAPLSGSNTNTLLSVNPTEEQQQQLIRQMNEALFRAENYVRAGEMQLRENQPIEAYSEFQQARLLLAREVDPKLNEIELMSQQKKKATLNSQISAIKNQRRELERRMTDIGVGLLVEVKVRKQANDIVATLRRESEAALQPIHPPTPYYDSPSSYDTQSLAARQQHVTLRQLQTSAANRTSRFEEDIARNIEILQQQGGKFQECLLRANRNFPSVTSILTAESVPGLVAYIALLESGFQPEARSSSGNAGLWQLSPSIARQYGLNVGGTYDERFQVQASTRAFARYMLQLYRQYGSWERAIAGFSPNRDYLLRLIAANRIANNPRQYGFYVELHNMTGRYDLLRADDRNIQSFSEPGFWELPSYQ